MKKVIVIVGPTGVGKTKLSIALAKRYDGEIINADAMQVYRGLDIGTAKVTEGEKENIPHHLFDTKEVQEEYSIYHYQKDCRVKIEEILNKGKVPILVGGTGLYIKGALYDYQFQVKGKDNLEYDSFSTEELYQMLMQLDPVGGEKIDRYNRRRLINAIQYYHQTQSSISENKTNTLLYDAIFIGLTTERAILYEKINQRVDRMMDMGLLDEVKFFYQKNVRSKPLISGIGYKELYDYLDQNSSKEEAIELIKRNSRRYAKRQYTFFNHQLPVVWFDVDYECFEKTIQEVCKYLDQES